MRKRWTGLVTWVAMVASLLAVNGTIGAKAAEPSGRLDAVRRRRHRRPDSGSDELNAALIKQGIAADPDHTRVLMLGDGAYPDGSFQTYWTSRDGKARQLGRVQGQDATRSPATTTTARR